MQKLQLSQDQRIILDVGKSKFKTGVPSLRNDPECRLVQLVDTASGVTPYSIDGVYSYFIDRCPRHFYVILNFLRDECIMDPGCLSVDVRHLQELLAEAKFYKIKTLIRMVERRHADMSLRI